MKKLNEVYKVYRKFRELNDSIANINGDFFNSMFEIAPIYSEFNYIKEAISRLRIEDQIIKMVEIIKEEEQLLESMKEVEFDDIDDDTVEEF